MFSKNGFLRTEGNLGCGAVWSGVMGQAARVRPIFNQTPHGVRATYPGTAKIPNLIAGSKKPRR